MIRSLLVSDPQLKELKNYDFTMRNSAKLLKELGVSYNRYYLYKYKHLNKLKPIYSKVWN